MTPDTLTRILIILALILATAITRFLPFLLFPEGRPIPRFVEYLSQNLPYATMALLVVYCLKGISLLQAPHGLPELLSTAFIILIHWWKENTFFSIIAGTVLYMILVQKVF